MDKTYYVVRNTDTGAMLRPYGSGYGSPPKLYLSYGVAQRYADENSKHGRSYEVIAVKLEELD